MNNENTQFPPEVIFGDCSGLLANFTDGRRTIVITDANAHLYNRSFIDEFDHIIIGQGEVSKTMHTIDKILKELVDLGVEREALIVGIGGGIVTDIAGFVASIYMRGVSFGFIPTTLLGQADASIGGKTGVNVSGYKNIVGTFNRPEFVIIDTAMLSTLPEREFMAGIAEVIKTAIIGDCELFDIVENHSPKDISENSELLEEVVKRSIAVKWNIVSDDEFETGNRRLLNLGHTFGHAIEKCSNQYNHGEAVSIGIQQICGIAEKAGLLDEQNAQRISNVLVKAGLPIDLPCELSKLLSAIKLDKKRTGNDSIYVTIPNSVGKCEVIRMSIEDLEKYLK